MNWAHQERGGRVCEEGKDRGKRETETEKGEVQKEGRDRGVNGVARHIKLAR